MIGETIKMGFDGSSVKRGLAGIMGGFGKLGRGIGRATRQVGIGAARRMGSDLFGFIVRGLQAIPNELSNLSDLRQEFFALGSATGVTVENMLALRQAIAKTSNISPDMASKVIQEMTSKIGEAQEFGSAAHKSLLNLGITRSEIKGKNPIDQLEMLSEAYRNLRKEAGQEVAQDVMGDLLGVRAAKKAIPLLMQWGEAMKIAKKETAGMSGQMVRMSKQLDQLDNVKIAFANKMSEAALGLLEGATGAGVQVKDIAGWIKSIDVAGFMKGFGEGVKTQFDKIKSMGIFAFLKEKLAALGAWLTKVIGDAITNGIKNAMPGGIKMGDMFKMFSGGGSGGDKGGGGIMNWISDKIKVGGVDSKAIERNTGETNRILSDIANNGLGGTYA